MWSSTHGAIGGAIVLVTPDPVMGLGLAFLSHFVMDYLGETSYKSLKEAAIVEANLLLVYICASTLGDFWLLMGGWVMANLPDLIDKPLRIIWGKREWFSCHNGKGLFQAFGYKLGYPVALPLTYWGTMLWNIASTLGFALIMILLRYAAQ
jgi:hypothetical protein